MLKMCCGERAYDQQLRGGFALDMTDILAVAAGVSAGTIELTPWVDWGFWSFGWLDTFADMGVRVLSCGPFRLTILNAGA